MPTAPRPALDPEHAAFLQGPASITLASRGPDNLPNISRGIGCRVARDRKRISIFLVEAQAAALLADIRANGMIAAVFSAPLSARSFQFKGADAVIERLKPGDARLLAVYRKDFVDEVEKLGFYRPAIEALVASTPEEVVAVTFTPSAAFSQTPGPAAGGPLQVAR